MKVRMLVIEAGPEGNFHPGDIREVSKKDGDAMIKGGYAEAYETTSANPVPSKMNALRAAVDEAVEKASAARAMADELQQKANDAADAAKAAADANAKDAADKAAQAAQAAEEAAAAEDVAMIAKAEAEAAIKATQG